MLLTKNKFDPEHISKPYNNAVKGQVGEKKEICGVCAAVCIAETGRFDGVPTYMCERTDEVLKETMKQAGL